jgi:hypothetical protein
MNRSSFVPLAVAATCIPCLLIPLAAALIAAGAFSGVFGLLGIPWVLAIRSGRPGGRGPQSPAPEGPWSFLLDARSRRSWLAS